MNLIKTSIVVLRNCPYLCHMLHRLRDDWLVVEALVLLLILVVNVYFLAWDDSLRRRELADRARRVLRDIEGAYGFVVLDHSSHFP